MFARMARRPGTDAYDDYYARRPELRAIDDRLRGMTPLLAPGSLHHDEKVAAETIRIFESIGEIEPDRETVDLRARRLDRGKDPTETLTRLALELGAVAAGCAPLDPAFVYTAKGRFDEDYGREVVLDHPSAIVFLVEMDHDAMRAAPRAEVIRESARQYREAARISMVLAAVIEAAGRRAKPHYDAHYDVILPPLAVRAGLGELGRNNILVADRHGSRVRIGAVTTDIDLEWDEPVDLGVRAFCDTCRKCAENCPSHALSTGPPEEVNGVRKWPTNVERCHAWWLHAGTDCGICMACCPFSHRDTPFHRFVRGVVRRLPFTHRAAKLGDDLLYGRNWKPADPAR